MCEPHLSKLKDTPSEWFIKSKPFEKDNSTFYVFKGTPTEEAKILRKNEVANYAADLIVETPSHLKFLYDEDISKALREFSGIAHKPPLQVTGLEMLCPKCKSDMKEFKTMHRCRSLECRLVIKKYF